MITSLQKHTKTQPAPKPRFINKIILTGILFTSLFVNFPVYAEDNVQFEDNIQFEDSAQSEDGIQPDDNAQSANNIRFFDEKLTISATVAFNTGTFTHENTGNSSDRILNVGLGLRYKNFSASFSIPIPFKITSFDLDINPYFDKIYYLAYIKYYKDFFSDKTNEKSGLDILSSAIMAIYVENHENHSLSSVINLDKKQLVSSGSLLYAFGTFFSSIYSTDSADKTMNEYNKIRQNLLYSGPGIGYSYTWVMENDMFLNFSTVIFTNMGINMITKELSFIPQLIPQFVFGQHFKTWSFNVKLANNSEIILKNLNTFDVLTFSSISAIVSKRF